VKKPRLIFYDDSRPTALGDSLLQEATIWETLIHPPHPNIIKYYGCHVEDGRITGLCFAKYHESLLERVNPGSSGKQRFDASQRPVKDLPKLLQGIEKGLEHIHSLGLVYNDLNPANIVFATKDDETPIMIGFGSCRPIGHSLKEVGRTPEWYDPEVSTSVRSNDTDALNELAEYLSLKPNKNFKLEIFC
jgi:serine/threonine protein kinase